MLTYQEIKTQLDVLYMAVGCVVKYGESDIAKSAARKAVKALADACEAASIASSEHQDSAVDDTMGDTMDTIIDHGIYWMQHAREADSCDVKDFNTITECAERLADALNEACEPHSPFDVDYQIDQLQYAKIMNAPRLYSGAQAGLISCH